MVATPGVGAWTARTGQIDEHVIREEASDFADRQIFVSGPEPMVDAFHDKLVAMGVAEDQIIGDWFPGYIDEFSRPADQPS